MSTGWPGIRADEAVFEDPAHWQGLESGELIERCVDEIALIFARNARLLRAVVLISGADPEVLGRGMAYGRGFGDRFTATVLHGARESIDRDDSETAVRSAFGMIFSALVFRVAYGRALDPDGTGGSTFVRSLQTMVRRYPLPRP